MTDNELLLAISGIMDTKLRAELQPLKDDLKVMKGEIQGIKDEIQGIKDEIQGIKDEMQGMKDEMQGMKDEIQTIKDDLHQVKLCQENVVIPRLDTIESCYTDTYRRYKNDADKMEAVFNDVELLKGVVTEHSEKLQQIVV